MSTKNCNLPTQFCKLGFGTVNFLFDMVKWLMNGGNAMFNVTIRQVGIEEREEIIICCHEISDEVMSLANSIKGQKSFLLASKDGEMFKLDTKEIFYIE